MDALLSAVLALQTPGFDDAALRRFSALLERSETRARGADLLSHADPAALRRLPGLEPGILEAAEQNAALRHSYGPPRLFSLEGREEALEDVLLRLERASGLAFHRSSLPRGLKVAVRLEDATILQALTELGRAASFSVLGVEGAQIYLSPGPPPARPRCFHGPLMIEMERISRRTRLRFDEVAADFWIRLAVWWEPHVVPLEGPGAARVARAVDDLGRSLLPAAAPTSAGRSDPYPRAGHGMATLEGLAAPADDAKTLSIDGSFDLPFPARVDTASFTKPGSASLPGLAVELKTLGPAPTGGLLVEVVVRFDDPARARGFQPSPANLVIDTETPLRGLRPSLTGVSVREKDVEFSVRVPGLQQAEDLQRLHVRVPEGRVVKRIPFRFEGVPLR